MLKTMVNAVVVLLKLVRLSAIFHYLHFIYYSVSENVSDTTDEVANGEEQSENEVLLGDMILSDDQMSYLYSTESFKRLGLTSPLTRWSNATVFYDIDKSLDRKGKEVVFAAMRYIEDVSCVRFKLKDKATKHHVLIKLGKACSSKVGMRRGRGPQHMIIDGNLCSKGSIIHELLHCLGFLHMHTANNRDDYIKVNWKNIRDDAKLNFKPFVAHVSMFDTEYDYDSITHYSSVAFAKDKNFPTITPKKPAPEMGQRKGKSEMNLIYVTIKLNAQTFHTHISPSLWFSHIFLFGFFSRCLLLFTEMSAGDITRLNRMYNCQNFEASSITLDSTTTTKSLTQFSNGATIKRVGLNKTKDNTDDLVMSNEKNEIELNPNDTLTNDDDMILSKEQVDALYSLNAAKRNGLKSAFHHWPMGVVAFEIDPTFRKTFQSF